MKEGRKALVWAGYIEGLKDAAKLFEQVAKMYEYGENEDSVVSELIRQKAALERFLEG